MDLEGAVLEGELAEGQQIAASQNAQDMSESMLTCRS